MLSVATLDTKHEERTMSVLKSLGVSIVVGVFILLGVLYLTQLFFGNIDSFLIIIFGCTILSAILYAAISARSFNYNAIDIIGKLARNASVAVLTGFLFTIVTSGHYSNVASIFFLSGDQFLGFFEFLMRGVVPLLSCIAFLIISVFSFDYTRRNGRAQEPKTSTVKAI